MLVISENNSRLIKYDRSTLSEGVVVMGDNPDTAKIENNFIKNPSGAILSSDGYLYAASYKTNSIVKVDTQTWTIIEELLPVGNNFIKGIDAGMTITEDRYLIVPGYDSDNIIKINLKTKVVAELVSANSGGLDGPRSIIIDEHKRELAVTAERSNAIILYDSVTGVFKEILVEIAGPTGMMKDGPDHFITNTSDAAFRISNDGAAAEKIILNGAGELSQGTFIYRLQKAITTTTATTAIR